MNLRWYSMALKIGVVAAALAAILVIPISISSSVATLNIAYAAPSCVSTELNPVTGQYDSNCTVNDLSTQCQASADKKSADCASADDQTVLQYLSLNQLGTNGEAEKKAVTSAGLGSGPTSCSGIWNNIKSPATCITRALFAGIGSFLLYIGIECLTASGLLFETILKYTVISFQTPMYASVQDAVNNAWTVFRDISNILIIGFFTFIAISTILGISEYGAKKLLSRVLIVAVLINFSLLFTKLIIDGSNFTAYQFYNASISNVDTNAAYASGAANAQVANVQVAGAAANTQPAKDKGIAGSFIQYLGVTGIADSYSQVSAVQEANDSAAAGLVLGVLGFIFLMATALVFLYGSFILAARAILFIFLLITSSLAFATYLIPKLSDNYGWSKWWKSLLSNAILAPILMMMLWVTLTVAAGVSKSFGSQGTLGDLIQHPTTTNNITALMNFVIILGLLFASFKLASKFSSGVGGFNFAAMIPALGLAAGAQIAGGLGRQTIGRAGMYASDKLQKASQKEGRSVLASRLFDFGAQKTKGIAKRDFNALGGTIGKAIAANSGFKQDTLTGGKRGGFLGGEEAKAKAAAEQARRINPKKDDYDENKSKVSMEQVRGSASLSKQHDEAVADHEKEQANAEEMKAALIKTSQEHDKKMQDLEAKLVEAQRSGDSGRADAAKLEITRTAGEHKMAIDAQTQRIAAANKAVQAAQNNIKHVVGLGTELAKAKGLVTEAYKDRTKELAGIIATSSFTNVLYSEAENARLAHLAEHEVTHQKNEKAMKDSGFTNLLKGALKEAAPEETPAPHTPTAAAPTSSTPSDKGESHEAPTH